MKFIAFVFALFIASTVLAQDQTQSQTPLDSPPQGWYRQQSEVTDQFNQVDYVFFFSKDSGWILGYRTGFIPIMAHTEDGGATWIICNTLPNGWTPFRFLDYNTGFAFYGDSVIKTTDAGITWSKPKFASTKEYIASTSVGKDTIYILDMGLFFSSDRGETWVSMLGHEPGVTFATSISFSDSKHGWVMGRIQSVQPNPQAAGLGKTTNGGQTWTQPYTGIDDDFICGYAIDSNKVFAAGNNAVYLSTNGGNNWQRIALNVSGGIGFYAMTFTDSIHGWGVGGIGNSWGGIMDTKDGGLTWNLQFIDTLGPLFDVSFVDSLTGWAIGDKGMILHTINGGKSWVQQYSTYDTIITQTYPEPAQTSNTNIHYTLPVPQHVSLALFDLTGHSVQTFLQNDFEVQGEHTIPVTLLPHLPAGTYMYHFSTECYSAIGKITLIAP
jgi:photosystem II stability/assembly factor-like uncharacterized protein